MNRSSFVKNTTCRTAPVFFMIGCQRSGSNWLRTMLAEREDLIAPHPPHILREFLPILSKFGDLEEIENLKLLVDHVCSFVEKNQVTWLDRHDRPLTFNRPDILKGSAITIDCLRASKRFGLAASPELSADVNEIIDGRYYLLAIFDGIMNKCAEANGCLMWMCKSMGMSQYYDMLLNFYGKERLRFIYLVRDPRDVTLSFMNTPVGDCHPYTVAKKWAKLQNHALQVLSDAPQLVHQVRYEHVLKDKVGEVAKINDFMGSRGVCKTLRRGSVVVLANDDQLSARAKIGREASCARSLSYQFKNLGRGDSFTKTQFAKYMVGMEDEDIQIVESVALEEMQRLGYNPHLVGKSMDPIAFTDQMVEEYTRTNEELINKMNADLAEENPDDLNRRIVQSSVLSMPPSSYFTKSFESMIVNRERLCYDTDDDNEVDDNVFNVDNIDFTKWPMRGSQVGYLTRDDIISRLEVVDTQTADLRDHSLTITYATASQCGYYPSDRKKANQDAFLSGIKAECPSSSKTYMLFSVFDGHGDTGDECAHITRDIVEQEFLSGIRDMKVKKQKVVQLLGRTKLLRKGGVDNEASYMEQMMKDAYAKANDKLKDGQTVDAKSSGTTAVSLCVCSDSSLYVANVGDSRCILISTPKKKGSSLEIQRLTNDHSPDREDEKARIENHGGLIMTSDQYDVMDPKMVSSEPKRVWSKEGKWPGSAFTRSIGDIAAKDLGVTCEPECMKARLTCDETMFVVGSDGIFDFISNDDVAEVVHENTDPGDACRALVGMAYHRWSEHEERTDDITIVVGRISKPSKMKKNLSLRRLKSAMPSLCMSNKNVLLKTSDERDIYGKASISVGDTFRLSDESGHQMTQ